MAFVLSLFVFLFFNACLGMDEENKTQLTLEDDGSIVQTIVDDSDGSVTGEELENYINDAISQFQSEYTGESVALEKCRVANGKVNITLEYSSANAYAAFNNVICFIGTVKEAYDAGYDFNRLFYAQNGTEVMYYELPRYSSDSQVLIIEEAVDVILPGSAIIVSEGVSFNSDGSVTVEENMDTSYSEQAQATTASPVFIIYKTQ